MYIEEQVSYIGENWSIRLEFTLKLVLPVFKANKYFQKDMLQVEISLSIN